MTSPYRLEGFGEDLDALIKAHVGPRRDLTLYDDGLTGFLRFVEHELKVRLPWKNPAHPERSQYAIAEAFFAHPLVVASTANADGKDYIAGLLMLWWVHCYRGRVILISAGEAQAIEISMSQVAQLWRSSLGSDLYRTSLRTDDEGVGLQVRAASTVHRLVGYHRRVLGVISEANGVSDAVFEAAMSWHADKLLALGNPVAPVGMFYRIQRPGSGWHVVEISAFDHPNFTKAEPPIEGGPTARGLEDMARTFGGTSSSYYIARALGKFPDQSEHCPIPRSWVDRGQQLLAAQTSCIKGAPTCGLDLGTTGDRTVLCPVDERGDATRDGLILMRPFTVFPRDHDSTRTVERVVGELDRLGVKPSEKVVNPVRLTMTGQPNAETYPYGRDSWTANPSDYVWVPGVGTVCIDASGLGIHIYNEFKSTRKYNALQFIGGSSPVYKKRQADKRTEAFLCVLRLLEQNRLGLLDDEELAEELVTIKLLTLPDGRVKLESKDDLKPRVSRSPDKLDALCMAVWGVIRPGRIQHGQPVYW